MKMDIIQHEPSLTLAEILETASRRAAEAFAEMLNLPVSVQLSQAEMVDQSVPEVNLLMDGIVWGNVVHIHFEDGASGESLFLLPSGHTEILVNALYVENPGLREEENSSEAILLEFGNVLLNASLGTIANRMGSHISYEMPEMIETSALNSLLEPLHQQPVKVLKMLSTLGVGEIKVSAYLILLIYTDHLGLKNLIK